MSVKSVLTALADAVRNKSGLTGAMTLEQMTEAVLGIQQGIDTSDATAVASDVAKGATAYVNGEKITGTHECEGGIDTSDATATASDMAEGVTAYVNGEKITGELAVQTSLLIPTVMSSALFVESSYENYISCKGKSSGKKILNDATVTVNLASSKLGDATAEDVVAGKTFTSFNGLKVTGTHECSSSTPTLQSKSVTPSESEQTVSPDDGYEGLSSVTVEAVSNTYVGSGVTKKADQTYTPGTADQTILAEQYLSGVQTIKGDSNLVAGNIKSGVSIFGVTGTYEGSGGSSGSIRAQYITSADDEITISGTGPVKVWGYGYYSSGSFSKTQYSFVGDGYYSSSSYGTPSKTSATFGIRNGKLSGLPNNIATLDVLVTIGI